MDSRWSVNSVDMVFIQSLKSILRNVFTSIVLIALLGISACTLNWNDNKPGSRTSKSTSTTKSRTRTPAKTGAQRPRHHVVRANESFYSISLLYGISYQSLAVWNNMSTKDVIFKGMKLRLYPPAGASSAKSSTAANTSASAKSNHTLKLQWPLRGRIIHRFNDQDRTIKGLDIGGQRGQRIKAAGSGKVVYAGSGLVGLGNVIVIKHNETYLTAYGYNEKLLFSEGDEVKQGEDIAIIGVGLDNQRMLHFEVRENGKPVNPLLYLPK